MLMENYIRELLNQKPDDSESVAEGWVRTCRNGKRICFFELSDGSTIRGLQVVIDKESAADIAPETIQKLTTGASVRVTGTIVPSEGRDQSVELQARQLELLGEAPPDSYPLQKKHHTLEFLREIGHLRPRTNTIAAVARVRNRACYSIHTFFQNRGFYYVHTPIISSSDCEGAGEVFQVTHLPMEDPPKLNGKIDYASDFFGKATHLTVSGQLEAEIYALAMKNVYTFGPTFRAENSNTSRHLAEFWMVEPEMAFCDIHGNMDLAEEFIKYIIQDLLDSCGEEMEFLDSRNEGGVMATLQRLVTSRFARISYEEAISHLDRSGRDFEFPVARGIDLQSEHECYLTEEVFQAPVILTDFPAKIKPFYMKLSDDGESVRGMDVLVPRLGEIIGGGERESDYDRLERRMDELNLNREEYWWYLELRRYGSVPHAGFGLGLERLIQYVTGIRNIRDAIPFPRTAKSAEF